MLSGAGDMQPLEPPRVRVLSFGEQKRAAAPSPPQVQYPKAPTTFRGFWDFGYHVIPVIPPSAQISEKSSLYGRIGTKQDGRGKTPGVMLRNGRWVGIDWLQHTTEESDLARWQAMPGASIGIKTGNGLVGIDADALDPTLAQTIADAISRRFVRLPVRYGRAPKALYLARMSEPLRYCRVEFGELNEKGKPKERIELLTEGRQVVVCGTHPVTGKPYRWPEGLPRFEDLPVFSPAFFRDFMEELRGILPNAAPIVVEGSTATVDQASLRGDLETVRRAVSLIPNTSAHFPSRESYLAIGYAIRAALPDDPDAGFTIYSDWCERWKEGTNEPEVVEADWRRMRPPFRRGASWLYEQAEQHAPGEFSLAQVWFRPIEAAEVSAFDIAAERDRNSDSVKAIALRPTPYAFPDPSRIPRRQWLYGDHYIRGFVSATVAPGGVGKSSLTIVEALAMASGKALLGVEPKGRFRVWLWNGEDPRDELERRIAAAIMHYGLTPEDIGDRLLVDTGVEQEIVLAREAHGDARIIEPMSAAIMSAVCSLGVDAMIVDPFVSTHKVSENDNGAIDLVVKRWAKIADRCQIAVELVHHVRKTNGTEVTVEDARGASAMVNAARATRALTRMTEAEGRKLGVLDYWRYFRFGGVTKSNLAPAAASPATAAGWFTLQSEALGNGEGSGVDAILSGDKVGVVTRAKVQEMAEPEDAGNKAEALKLIAGGDWRADVRAGDAWVGHAVARAFGLDASDASDRMRINGLLRQWRQDRCIHDEARADKSRHMRQFVRVSRPATVAPATSANVFG